MTRSYLRKLVDRSLPAPRSLARTPRATPRRETDDLVEADGPVDRAVVPGPTPRATPAAPRFPVAPGPAAVVYRAPAPPAVDPVVVERVAAPPPPAPPRAIASPSPPPPPATTELRVERIVPAIPDVPAPATAPTAAAIEREIVRTTATVTREAMPIVRRDPPASAPSSPRPPAPPIAPPMPALRPAASPPVPAPRESSKLVIGRIQVDVIAPPPAAPSLPPPTREVRTTPTSRSTPPSAAPASRLRFGFGQS